MSAVDTTTVPIVAWTPEAPAAEVLEFLQRPTFDPEAEKIARPVLADIKAHGDDAVLRYVKQFDGVTLTADQLRVSRAEINDARAHIEAPFAVAAREAHNRISAFARAGMKKDWSIPSPKGGTLGEQYAPFDRVGVYIPGGAAPLVSTALMTATLARTAGVLDIVACTPADPEGRVNPALLFALELAGATEIYKIGGIQAIGAMAYGTPTVAKVQKIAGPGGPYVTAAKRCVYGDVALDLVAGPSEIAILADESALAANIAADLLSQAEHGTGKEKCLLITTVAGLAESVRSELLSQAATLSRKETILEVLTHGTLLVVVSTLDAGIDLCNRFAPEHLELMVREPRTWVKKVRHAGAVFVGAWTPECAGDFVAGPSHVLPTGGAAAMFSGLTVDDFRKRTSVITFTRADLQDTVGIVELFGKVEGLDAHARSATIRFKR